MQRIQRYITPLRASNQVSSTFGKQVRGVCIEQTAGKSLRKPLDEDDLKEGLAMVPSWCLKGNGIARKYEFQDFTAAWKFMSEVAERADSMDHHPDWSNCYNKVHVTLSTHSAGGITSLDISLANFMDATFDIVTRSSTPDAESSSGKDHS